MKSMGKKILALVLASCLGLLCAAAARAAESAEPWSKALGDGSFVLKRIEYTIPEGMPYGDSERLLAVYSATGETVAISGYAEDALYAVVPAGRADEALEARVVEKPAPFTDQVQTWNGSEYDQTPLSAKNLALRGVLRGNDRGELLPGNTITRAEAFTLVTRVLGVQSTTDPGYADARSGDWYYETAAAARACGIAAADANFNPCRTVTRGEIMTMVYRAFVSAGMVEGPAGDEALDLADAAAVPDWALEAYQALRGNYGLCITTATETEELDSEGFPISVDSAEALRGATRGEVAELLYSAIRFLPVYPSKAAIEYGFTDEMPVIDGSTSTYPYTRALYAALFRNYDNHSQFPASHSKSHESYQRLISGEVDVLFAATEPSEELKAQARAAGVELELIPIAYDAMVFFTNEENSAAGLTQKQIRDIYVNNAYANWNQVGGPDAALLPYCRNTDSGSHALMERYFLNGGKLSLNPAILQGNVSQAMSSALTDVAAALETNPTAYAIGYSVYYYYLNAQTMMGDVTNNQLKLLAVDGVAPSDKTIADGTYPLAGYNYVVLRSDEPQNSPARRLSEFMLSERGQECVQSAGFGQLKQ